MAGLLVAGTTSDAGKSLVVTGLCRVLRRRGLRVAPFKAQNMSNNSMVCPDGSEIGRAQHLQAIAAGLEPDASMNPVLLKPSTDRRAFVVLDGQPAGHLSAGEYPSGRGRLAEAAFAAYRRLSQRVDVVIAEGAGSPAEINLRDRDYVNMGLARHAGLPVLVVGDIDRGGMLAAAYGTWALLDDADRALLRGFLVNKFRGDVDILQPGLEEITRRTGVPVLGVLPWLADVWLDSEDALAVAGWRTDRRTRGTQGTLRIAVVPFPRISNATDVDALAGEPGVDVAVTASPQVCRGADLVVLPGTRSTLADLAWLRERGLADVVLERARTGRPVLGLCGGYQMLSRWIEDDGTEAEIGGTEPGLGVLPTRVTFTAEKVLTRPAGSWRGHDVSGYAIHHGRVQLDDAPSEPTPNGEPGSAAQLGSGPRLEPFLDGWRHRNSWGTMWHGAFESDAFRRAWLGEIAAATGSTWRPADAHLGYADRREAMIDRLADALEQHTDIEAIVSLATESLSPVAPPAGAPPRR